MNVAVNAQSYVAYVSFQNQQLGAYAYFKDLILVSTKGSTTEQRESTHRVQTSANAVPYRKAYPFQKISENSPFPE